MALPTNLPDTLLQNALPADSSAEAIGGIQTGPLFTGHELKTRTILPVEIQPRNDDWFTFILFAAIAWITWTRVSNYKILKQLIAAFFNINVTNQIVRDENILVQRTSVMLTLLFYLVMTLFGFQALTYFNIRTDVFGQGILSFLLLFPVIALAYSLKTILIKVLGTVFEAEKPATSFIFNVTLINNVTGIFLLPVIVFTAYMDLDFVLPAYYAGIAILIMSFIYRQIRAFRIWMTMPGVSLFYLILYICTLEISPLLIMIRIAAG